MLAACSGVAASSIAALTAGEIRIEGSKRAVNRFLGLFPAPEPEVQPQS